MSMTGMDNTTGKPLDGLAHLRQSITDILTTPIGSRVMRRDYGSKLFTLIDAPMHPRGILRIYAAVATALEQWEPRLRLTRVRLNDASIDGRLSLTLEGEYLPDGRSVTLEGIQL